MMAIEMSAPPIAAVVAQISNSSLFQSRLVSMIVRMTVSFPLRVADLLLCLSSAACRTGQPVIETRSAVPVDDPSFTILRAESPGQGPLFPKDAAFNEARRSASLDDTARMLAGLTASGGDAYRDVRSSQPWLDHASRLDELWADYEGRHERPIRAWAAGAMPDLARSGTVFYPFSGPDFLFANAFFPHAETTVLCGLEPAEPLPDLSSLTLGDIENGLSGLRHALNNVLQLSYFITKDMRNDLQSTRFRGVLPVLLVFLARSGHTVESVDAVRLDAGGQPVLVSSSGNAAPGLLIRARSPGAGMRRIFYFRQDLSNDTIKPGAPFLAFISQLGWPPAFTKSASYLMHEESFSNIRSFLLQNCRAIVQDPSGVPYRHLVEAGLDVKMYGSYQGTLDIFSEHSQPDLIEANRQQPAGPLDFGIGYLYRPATTSLMVARARR